MQQQVAFIGAGNMARAIIGGLVESGAPASHLRVADALPEVAAALARDFGVALAQGNIAAVTGADIVVLAVKPQQMRAVAGEIRDAVASASPLVLSIAAGITTVALRGWLGEHTAVIRSMPNTPALIRKGTTVLFASPAVTPAQRAAAAAILGAVGAVHWVDDESLLDAVTALSGSGPAYVFRLLECLESAGSALGLPGELARALALETVAGAATLACDSGEPAAVLRARVTSKGGTTERALAALDEGGLQALFERALAAAADRSRGLAAEFGAA